MIGESRRWTAVLTGDGRGATARSGPVLTVCGTTGRANPSTWPLGPSGSTTCPRGARKLGLCEVESEEVKVSRGAIGRVAVTVGRIGGRSCQAARCNGAGDVDPVAAAAELLGRRRFRIAPSPPAGHLLTSLVRSVVDPADLLDKPLTLGVLEIEQVVERPVEVDRRRTRPLRRAGRARTSRFPQAPPGDVDGELVLALRAGHRGAGVPLLVDPPVQVLQERQVGGEQVLDDPGVDVVDRRRSG